MENQNNTFLEDLYLGVYPPLDELTKAAEKVIESTKKINKRKMENERKKIATDPATDHMMNVIKHQAKMIEVIEDNTEEPLKGKVIELQAQDVTSKEEQLITRKRTAKMFLEDIVRQVDQGNLQATFAALQIKQLKKEFDNTLFRIEDQAKEELVGTDYYIYGDHKLTYKQGSKGVDYSQCKEVVLMEKHLKELKGKYKAALDGVEKGVTQTLEDHKFVDANGEICKLPQWKYNKSSIQLTKV